MTAKCEPCFWRRHSEVVSQIVWLKIWQDLWKLEGIFHFFYCIGESNHSLACGLLPLSGFWTKSFHQDGFSTHPGVCNMAL